MKLKSLLKQVSFSSRIWLILPILWSQKPVNSQIIPDQTLGHENTIIRSIDQLKKQIEGGAIRGANLFHSLQEFNILENHSVYFTNPAGIENILTRITGNNASNILGKLGVDGAANLFLINPNGIFFGPNATLDIRGSFLATTADEIRLGENGLFSATNPQNNNLLSVAPSALFFNQIGTQTGNIINTATETGLEIPSKESLGLVGNQVIIEGGKLTAEQGRIEIGSVGNQSLIEIENTENNYVLNYAEVENFNNIEFKNNAVVDVSGEGSGEIQIQGKQIVIKEKPRIVAETLGAEPGGNISLTARESIEVNNSRVESNVRPGATGNGASITIDSPGLTMANGGEISTSTFGAGQGGSIEINVADLEVISSVISVDSNSNNDMAITTIGKGGNLKIDTQRLSLKNGGRLLAVTSGGSQGGNISINAREIEASGISLDGSPSGIDSRIQEGATGNGGNVTINTQRLIQTDGAVVQAIVSGSGQGGDITVNAREIQLLGNTASETLSPEESPPVQSITGEITTSLFTTVVPGATGRGGNLTVNTQNLTLRDGSLIGTGTFGSGDSGDLTVKATEINVAGTNPTGRVPSSLFTTVFSGATGNGGNLNIDAERLHLRTGAQIRAGTLGLGQSGDLTIRAKDIELTGRSDDDRIATSILASVQDLRNLSLGQGKGDGGDAFIQTERLTILDGAEVSTITEGDGEAGNLTINATDNITLSGVSSISGNSSTITASSEIEATQRGGNLNITTPTLNLSNGAVVTARSRSNSDGGNIFLNVNNLNLASGAQILTSSFNEGNAGNININADSAITLSGIDVNFNARVALFGEDNVDTDGAETAITSRSGGNGNAGSVTINTPQLRVENMGIITVSSSGNGEAGSLVINAPSLQLNNGTLSAETVAGDQGNITIQASEINLQNQSQITTNATNSATGGDINIDTKFLIGSDNSNISANALEGEGGNISISAEGVFLDNSSQITATSALGIDGSVELNTQVDPTQGVVKLSASVIDAESLVAQNLCTTTGKQKQESSFVITGRGGLPPDPTQSLTVLRGTVEWESNSQEDTKVVMSEYQQPVVVYRRIDSQKLPQITQAMGWVMSESGKVTLTSTANGVNSASPQLIHPSCYLFLGSRELMNNE